MAPRQRRQGARQGPGDRPRCRVKTGRFGPYLQLGETSKDKEREAQARRHPEGLESRTIDARERAEAALAAARSRPAPEDGEPILAGIGRYGPYVQHGKTYANLDAEEDVLAIGLNRAVTLIAEKRANPGKGRRFGADPGRSLGDHPQRGGPILVKKGRYGPT